MASKFGKFLEPRNVKFDKKRVYQDVYKINKSQQIRDTAAEEESRIDWKCKDETKKEIEVEKSEVKSEAKKSGRPRKSKGQSESSEEKTVQKECRRPCTRSQDKRKLKTSE